MSNLKVMYGLTHKGELLGFYVTDNGDAEFCNPVSYELSTGDPLWLVDERETAEYVQKTSTEWYNAGHDHPENRFVGECEVVKVTLLIEAC